MKTPKILQNAIAALCAGAAAGAFLGFGYEDLAQHFEKAGVAATLFGAQLGLLGYDWGAMCQAALVGSGVGSLFGLGWFGLDATRGALAARRARKLRA